MKKLIPLIIFFVCLICLSFFGIKKDKEVLINKKENTTSFISMMVENEEGKYIEKTDMKFPGEEYLFNPEASGCENGGLLSWNSEKEKIVASLITSDKCYAYFDKYDFTKSCLYGYEENMACELIKKKDETLIYHDGKSDYDDMINYELEAGDLSYRFSGTNPNNYLCFGGECSNNSNDPNYKNLYRIIGLFKNPDGQYEIKIIKADATTKEDLGEGTYPESAYSGDYIYTKINYKGKLTNFASYYWNSTLGTTENANNVNMWKESNLNTKNLNEIYYNKIDSIYQNMIVSHEWQIGGITIDNNAKTTYDYELGSNKLTNLYDKCYNQGDMNSNRLCNQTNDLTYKDEIGLIYISDYMYATLPKYWNNTAQNYEQEDLLNNNWLYLGLDEWTISRYANHARNAKIVNSAGSAYHSAYVYSSMLIVRPVLYLKSSVKIQSGNGSEEVPYRITFE